MPTPISDADVAKTLTYALMTLGCPAGVAPPHDSRHSGLLELQDEEGDFLEFIPFDASPELVAIAYRLYGRGLNRGTRAGEQAAWAKLRALIGAAPAATDR